MIGNALLLALREIRRNLMRAFLTVLGIVIGVAAVVTMVTLGNGATTQVQRQIASLGSNLLILRPGKRLFGPPGADNPPRFAEADAQAIAEAVPGVVAVAPSSQRAATTIYLQSNWSTTVTGSTQAYFEVGNWKLSEGRVFTLAEQRAGRMLCVIGETVRKNLFAELPAVEQRIRLGNVSCEVIGVLSAKGQSAMGQDQDDSVVVPLRAFRRQIAGRTSSHDVSSLTVSLQDGVEAAAAIAEITSLMRERRQLHGNAEDNFSVTDTRQLAEALSGTTRVLTGLLGAVAAVSLLVGGIGIMNIMLVSVTERTREIGTRLAIGARARDVLLQFLVEAMVLSALGGALGVALALLASWGLCNLMQVPFIFDLRINLIAFSFAAAIGVLFGYEPARRAARLNPIDALRHE